MINKNAIYLTVYKRSRGPAEQKAMFAKMGAAGKLRAKGPTGKRTGDELPATDDDFFDNNPPPDPRSASRKRLDNAKTEQRKLTQRLRELNRPSSLPPHLKKERISITQQISRLKREIDSLESRIRRKQ